MASGVDFEVTKMLVTVHHPRSCNFHMTVSQLQVYVDRSVSLGVGTLSSVDTIRSGLSQTTPDPDWIWIHFRSSCLGLN